MERFNVVHKPPKSPKKKKKKSLSFEDDFLFLEPPLASSLDYFSPPKKDFIAKNKSDVKASVFNRFGSNMRFDELSSITKTLVQVPSGPLKGKTKTPRKKKKEKPQPTSQTDFVKRNIEMIKKRVPTSEEVKKMDPDYYSKKIDTRFFKRIKFKERSRYAEPESSLSGTSSENEEQK